MPQRQPSDRELDRLERMLERCIEADKAARKERRTRPDPFYEKLKLLTEMQKKWEEERRAKSNPEDDEPKH